MADDQTNEVDRSADATRASRRLARLLVDSGILTEENIAEAQAEHPGEYLGDVLIREGILLQDYLNGLLIRILRIPYLPANCCNIEPGVRGLLSETFCREHRLMPVSKARDFLTVICANPLDEEALADIEEKTGLRVRRLLCTSEQMEGLIDKEYSGTQEEHFPIEMGGQPSNVESDENQPQEKSADALVETLEAANDGEVENRDAE